MQVNDTVTVKLSDAPEFKAEVLEIDGDYINVRNNRNRTMWVAKWLVKEEPKVIPHPPVYRVRGYDTNEAEADEYRNG